MEIRIGEVGRITAGDDTGSYVKVVDDAANTGGYLILTASAPDMGDGFDNWVENKDVLTRYFIESGWTIEWL
jgi:hypothetical protein